MNNDKILRAIGGIDEELIYRAEPKNIKMFRDHESKKPGRNLTAFAIVGLAVAACALFVVFALPALLRTPDDSHGQYAIISPGPSPTQSTEVVQPKLPDAYAQKLCSYAYKLNDWVYYINQDDNGYIYKIKTDGTENTKLCEIRCENFKVAGEWIFFNDQREMAEGMFQDDGYKWLFKMRLDGSDFTKISLNHTGVFEIFDNSIFFIETDIHSGEFSIYAEPSAIYKMNFDGTGKTKLTQNVVNAEKFQIDNDFVYYYIYTNDFNGVSLYRMRPDGSENQKIWDRSIEYYSNDKIFDGWGYHISSKSEMPEFHPNRYTHYYNYGINRTNIDSGKEQKITDGEDGILDFTVYNDSIYYISEEIAEDWEFSYSIKKVNADGTGKTKLADIKNDYVEINAMEINVTDGYIYFTDQDENGIDSLFKISLNGLEKQKVQLSETSNKINLSEQSEGWLVYSTSAEGESSWFTVRTDGSNDAILFDLFSPNMQIAGNKIYSSSSFYDPYYFYMDPYGIWSRDLNGKNKKMIYSSDKYVSFKIMDEHIFISTTQGLIRTDLNGKNETKISDDCDLNLDSCIIMDDWIYYVDIGKTNSNLYKTSMDGKSKIKILVGEEHVSLHDAFVSNGWIYCVWIDEKLCKISMDGKKKTELASNAWDYKLYNNELYYTLGNGDFCKLDLSNDKLTKLFNINTSSFTISGDIVYFSNEDDNGYLYKISLSGGNATKIRDHSVSNIVVAGDVIYYINEYNNSLYRINVDGSGNKRITSGGTRYFQFFAD